MQVPQVQPIQPQNMLQQVMLFNQMNEARRETQEKNALRELLSDPNLDTSNPETFRKIIGVAPKAGPTVVASLARANADDRAGRSSTLAGELSGEQRKVAAAARFRDELPGVLASANPADAYKSWRTRFAETMGATNLPEEFPGDEAVRGIMMNATQSIEAAKTRFENVGGVPRLVLPSGDLRTVNILPPAPLGPVPVPGGPQADATGVPSYPVNPTRLAQMQQAGQRFAPGLMASGAPPPNAMIPPQTQPPANAMTPSTNAEEVLQAQKDREAARAAALDATKKDQERVAKKVETMPAVQSAARASIDSLDAQIREIDELMGRPVGRYLATGPVAGRTYSPTGLLGSVQGAQANIDKMKAGAGLEALQELRKSSPAGSGLGSVSNAEGTRLQDSRAALSQLQDTADFDKQALKYKSDLALAKQRILEAYKREYGEDLPADVTEKRVGAQATRQNDLTIVGPAGEIARFKDKETADKAWARYNGGQ
jgi:hypothetical protein